MRKKFRSILRISLYSLIVLGTVFLGCSKNPADADKNDESDMVYTVTRPASSQNILIGDTLAIKWTSEDGPVSNRYVRIDLFCGDSLIRNISRTVDDGSYNWTNVATTFDADTGFRIRVADDKHITTRYGYSESFSIECGYEGSIEIRSPQSDTILTPADSFSIRWDTTGSPGPLVRIDLYDDSVPESVISSSTVNDGTYAWTVPSGLAPGDRYRIRLSSFYIDSINDYSDFFTIAGIDEDIYEVDNSRSDADTMEVGFKQTHTLSESDTDWIAVTLVKDTAYFIITIGNARTHVEIFNGNSSSPDSSYTAYSTAIASVYKGAYTGSTSYIPESTGIYFLRITPADNISSRLGSYTVSVSEMNTHDSITITSPDSTSLWDVGTSHPVQWDTAGFNADKVTISLYKGFVFLARIYLSTANDGIQSCEIPKGIESGSDYHIRISAADTPIPFGRSADFTIRGTMQDQYEDDDTRETASSFELGSSRNQTLTENDTDWISLELQKDTTYLFYSKGNAHIRLSLFPEDANDALVKTTSKQDIPGDMLYTPEEEGVYFLRITPYSTSISSQGRYELLIRSIDTTTNRIAITSPAAEAEWVSGNHYEISWDTTSVIGSTILISFLVDNILLDDIYYITDAYTGNASITLPDAFPTSDNCRILLQVLTMSYISGISDSFSVTGMSQDEYENDNTRATAQSIVPDEKQERSLTTKDIDWVAVEMTQDSVYYLQFSGSTAVNGKLFFNDSSSYIVKFDGNNSDHKDALHILCPRSGTYYLEITPTTTDDSSSYGLYTLSLFSAGKEGIIRILEPSKESVWAAGSKYTIRWDTSKVIYSSLAIYLHKNTSSIQRISSETQNDGSYSWTIPDGLATAGNYRIHVLGGRGTKSSPFGLSDTFIISGVPRDAYEPDDTPDLANTIPVDSTVQQRTIAIADTDWCSFPHKIDHLYVVSMNGITDGTLTLFNETGTTEYLQETASTDSLAAFFWFVQDPGTALIKIFGTGGTYRLSVKEYDSSAYQFDVSIPEPDSLYRIDSVMTITWSGPLLASDDVDIFLFDQDGIVQTIVADTPNDGTYEWAPTAITTGEGYYIRIISKTSSKITGESGVFELTE